MKKILLVLVLCLSTIGLAGCGSSAPTKVQLNAPQNDHTYNVYEVGKDIAPGDFTITLKETTTYPNNTRGEGAWSYFFVGDKDSSWTKNLLDQFNTNKGFDTMGMNRISDGETFTLKEGQYLFIYDYSADIILSK